MRRNGAARCSERLPLDDAGGTTLRPRRRLWGCRRGRPMHWCGNSGPQAACLPPCCRESRTAAGGGAVWPPPSRQSSAPSSGRSGSTGNSVPSPMPPSRSGGAASRLVSRRRRRARSIDALSRSTRKRRSGDAVDTTPPGCLRRLARPPWWHPDPSQSCRWTIRRSIWSLSTSDIAGQSGAPT